MKSIRRLFGLVFGVAGVLGLLLCIAGVAGCWMARADVLERLDRAFARADQALADAKGDLDIVGKQLRQTQTEVAAVQQREADLPSQPPAERSVRRALSRKALESQKSQLDQAREMLVTATEIGLVVNGLLDALGELPLAERLNVDVDRLKVASSQVSDVTDRSARLANMLAKVTPDADAEIAGESSNVAETLNRIVVAIDGGAERVELVRGRTADGQSRIRYWINVVAIAITVLLLWIGLGQFCLLLRGKDMVRR